MKFLFFRARLLFGFPVWCYKKIDPILRVILAGVGIVGSWTYYLFAYVPLDNHPTFMAWSGIAVVSVIISIIVFNVIRSLWREYRNEVFDKLRRQYQ